MYDSLLSRWRVSLYIGIRVYDITMYLPLLVVGPAPGGRYARDEFAIRRDVTWRDVTISSPNVWRQFCGVNSRFAHLSKINLVPSIPRPRPAVARRSSHQKLHCTFCQLFLNLLLGRTIIYYRETVVYAY